MRFEDQQEHDALLDAALANYSTEPDFGLDKRVLARVRNDARRRRIVWWNSAGVLAATLVLMALFLWPYSHHTQTPTFRRPPQAIEDCSACTAGFSDDRRLKQAAAGAHIGTRPGDCKSRIFFRRRPHLRRMKKRCWRSSGALHRKRRHCWRAPPFQVR